MAYINVGGICINSQITSTIATVTEIFVVLTSIAVVIMMYRRHKIIKKEVLLKRRCPSEYAVLVSNLPAGATKKEILNHFNNLYDPRAKFVPHRPTSCFDNFLEPLPDGAKGEHTEFVPVQDNSLDKLDADNDRIDTTGGWVASVTVLRSNSKKIRSYKSAEKILLKIMRARAKVKKAYDAKEGLDGVEKCLENLAKLERMLWNHKDEYKSSNDEKVQCAIVLFKYRESFLRCIHDYRFSDNPCGRNKLPQDLWFNGLETCKLRVIPAPPPEAIIWENVEDAFSCKSRFLRKSLTTVIALAFMLCVVGLASVLRDIMRDADDSILCQDYSWRLKSVYMENDTPIGGTITMTDTSNNTMCALNQNSSLNINASVLRSPCLCSNVTYNAGFTNIHKSTVYDVNPFIKLNEEGYFKRVYDPKTPLERADIIDIIGIMKDSVTGNSSKNWANMNTFCSSPCIHKTAAPSFAEYITKKISKKSRNMTLSNVCLTEYCKFRPYQGSNSMCLAYPRYFIHNCYCVQEWNEKLKNGMSVFELLTDLLADENICYKHAITKVYSLIFKVITILVILGLNTFSDFFMRKLTMIERPLTHSDIHKSAFMKIFLTRFINTAIVFLLVNARVQAEDDDTAGFVSVFQAFGLFQGDFSSLTLRWYQKVGSFLTLMLIINIMEPHIAPSLRMFFNFVNMCRCCARDVIQRDLNNRMSGIRFNIQDRYPQMMGYAFTVFAYSAGFPVLYIAGLFYVVIMYIFDKLAIFHSYDIRGITGVDGSLSMSTLRLFPVAIVLHICIAVYMHSIPEVFPAGYIDSVGSGRYSFFDYVSTSITPNATDGQKIFEEVPIIRGIFVNHNIPALLLLLLLLLGIFFYTFFGHVIQKCTNKLFKDHKKKQRRRRKRKTKQGIRSTKEVKSFPGYTEKFVRNIHEKDLKSFVKKHHTSGNLHMWSPLIKCIGPMGYEGKPGCARYYPYKPRDCVILYQHQNKIRIHYVDMKDRNGKPTDAYDEWIDKDSDRIRPESLAPTNKIHRMYKMWMLYGNFEDKVFFQKYDVKRTWEVIADKRLYLYHLHLNTDYTTSFQGIADEIKYMSHAEDKVSARLRKRILLRKTSSHHLPSLRSLLRLFCHVLFKRIPHAFTLFKL